MKIPRAILLMLTGLAGGIGVRLAFTAPEENAVRHSGRAGEKAARAAREAAARPETAQLRPDATAVLTARGGSRLRLLMAWLPGAGEEELLRMASALTGPDQEENLSIRLLMARWAEVNPAAMLTWTRAQTDDRYGIGFYANNAIEAWARVDFDSAWSSAGNGLAATRGSALLGLTAVDPAKCLSLLRADPSLLDLSGFTQMSKVLTRIAARDPAGAATLLDGGTAARLTKYAGNVALAWARSDPAAAVVWMQRLDPGVRATSLEDAAKWIAGHAPEQLPALLESLPPGRVRSMAAAAGFSRLASTDPAAARRQLDAMPASPSRQFCRGLLMKELVRAGDEAGAIALASLIGWQLSDNWCPNVATVVSSGGTGIRRSGDDGSNGITIALQELMGRVAARNPQEAAALLAKSTPGTVSVLLTDENVTNHAALAAALMAPGDENAAMNCQSVVNVWSHSDPAAAAAWVAAHVPSGEERSAMMDNVFMNWAGEPSAMLQWAATMDADTVREAWGQIVSFNLEYTTAHLEEYVATADAAAYEALISRADFSDGTAGRILQLMPDNMNVSIERPMQSWLTEKPEEATEWVRGLPEGARRTNATAQIVSHLNETGDHEGAFAWAVTLPEEKREEAMSVTLESWRSEIRARALPPEEQQQLLDSLPDFPGGIRPEDLPESRLKSP